LTVNIMTLGGIAAAVGLIIDDAIVIIENIFTQFARKPDPANGGPLSYTEAASRSLKGMMPAILGSTASTIVIHIPLAFLGGITGAFFASLSITMVFAMLISFMFSISLAPLLASFLLREGDIAREEAQHQSHSRFDHWYERIMKRILPYRLIIIPIGGLLIVLTYYLYSQVGTDFMPRMDEGTFVLDYWTPPGTSLTETNRILMDIEHLLMRIPEVNTYSRRTGTQLGFFLTEPNTGDFLIMLKKDRSRDIDEVISEVRDSIAVIEPGVRVEFGQIMMDVIGDLTNDPSPVEIKLFGEDAPVVRQKAEEIQQVIEQVPGVVDAFNGIVIAGPSLVVTVDPMKASLAGFNADDVREELTTVMEGSAGTNVQFGEKLIPVRVSYPAQYRTDLEKIEGLTIFNSTGVPVPLRSIATIERTSGQPEINREGLRQVVAVTARISGRDLGGTIAQIQREISTKVVFPRGMSVEYGGVYQTQQESFYGLVLVALAAFMLVFIVLLFEFGEFAVPASIFIINIMSLLGVVGALWIAGVTFNISSFVGLIMIIGIVAENAIFLMHEMKNLRREGVPLDDALIRAALMRRRPILMTTLAAVFALLPLALGIGAGSQMQQPLAIAVLGGFSVSSFLLIFGLPLVYRLFKTAD
jgi:multidrug efflux pump subunit AcrB